MALDFYTTYSVTISESRKSLNEIVIHLKINVIWVPESNCIADELARQGTTADIIRDKDTVVMPLATCKFFLKQSLYTFSKNRLITISTCNTFRLTWPNNSTKKTNSPKIQQERHIHSN